MKLLGLCVCTNSYIKANEHILKENVIHGS
jgi:hypothetical protein